MSWTPPNIYSKKNGWIILAEEIYDISNNIIEWADLHLTKIWRNCKLEGR